MATVDVKVPAVGESVQEAMIHKWLKASGDIVKMDDVLMELETDKATVEVTATAAGRLETLKKEGETVAIGEVIARIDPSQATQVASVAPPAPATVPVKSTSPQAAVQSTPQPLSPAVKRLVTENNLNPSDIAASGKGGRLTKGDVLEHLSTPTPTVATPAPQPQVKAPEIKLPTPRATTTSTRGEHREPMSMLRRRVAERLKQAQNTAAMLTTFNEVNMQPVMDLRKQYKDAFQKRHGVGLGFMSFFVKAAIEALREFPQINGWIDQNDIVYHDYYDIGVAVSGDRGLVVPVIRDAEKLSMAEIEQTIGYFGARAREGKIGVDEMTGGTFTISNGGVFGSLLSTPILNPPQSAILGMHKIEDRPIALNGQVVIRPMMYLALSYDHRIVDGREAVQFLVKIKETVEDPTRLLLGV